MVIKFHYKLRLSEIIMKPIRSFLFDNLPLRWQMSLAEKFILNALLDYAKPDVAIEVGTYEGGSLQVISKYARKVYALDIDPHIEDKLKSQFSNVEFIIGDSSQTLPKLVEQINAAGERVGFVLIDGEHSMEGVRRDINSVLKLIPKGEIIIVMHDSFNPDCREGIKTADWSSCKYLDFLKVDYVSGTFFAEPFFPVDGRTMWGGFAVGCLTPKPRDLNYQDKVLTADTGLYDVVYLQSSHFETKA